MSASTACACSRSTAAGRQADALGAYRRARDELVNAIGIEPGPDLRRLHEAILRQDPSLDLPLPAELPPELEVGTPLVGRAPRSSTRYASTGAAPARATAPRC